jgi:hypothetical protein
MRFEPVESELCNVLGVNRHSDDFPLFFNFSRNERRGKKKMAELKKGHIE